MPIIKISARRAVSGEADVGKEGGSTVHGDVQGIIGFPKRWEGPSPRRRRGRQGYFGNIGKLTDWLELQNLRCLQVTTLAHLSISGLRQTVAAVGASICLLIF
jgi:hypothetical protein